MGKNNSIGEKFKFQNLPGVPDNQKITAPKFNELVDFQNSPVQQITGSLDDSDIIIDGTKNYGTTIVVAGSTRTITANASGHLQGNNIKQRYTFNVDCTLTLTNFDATGNNTGTITPIPAGTYDFQYFANRNGRNLEIAQNIKSDGLLTTPNTWYVNSNVDAGNVGSDNFPFKTIQVAHDAASPFDTIIIQNSDFSQPSSPATSITKDLVIKGIATNVDGQALLKGAWTFTAGVNVRFENIGLGSGTTFDSTALFVIYMTNCATSISSGLQTGGSRFMFLIAQNSANLNFGTTNNLYAFESYNCRITGDINVGRGVTLYNSSLVGDSVSGLDLAQPMVLYDSTIKGNGTVTGDLEKYNSVITGDETVSGTTVNRQAKVFDDSVEFKDKVSIGVATFLNSLDVAGGMAVGSGYAAIATAPADGALFEGPVAIGRTTVLGGAILHTEGLVRLQNASGFGLVLGSSGNVTISTTAGTTGLTLSDASNGIFDFKGGSQIWRQVSLGSGNYEIRDQNQAGASRIVIKGTSGFVGFQVADPKTSGHFNGAITQNELSSDPSDPAEGQSVTWQSDGTGSGDDGDIMMKITAGGTTKTTTLVDFSAI